jgi:hypothetical protein
VVAAASAVMIDPALARAETRRFAVVVASNVGGGAQPPLHFAEADADKLAAVLAELGSFKRADLLVLKAASVDKVQAALLQTAAQVASWREHPGHSAVVLFYFSGHSDGQALELGAGRLAFSDVRRLLEATNADVRLAIVDSCRSGGLLSLKGGAPGPSFEVHLSDNLASAGEAFITSSAADETALESSEIRGSFFSHHLISGLRGAADASGDGQVTLVEAYQYAYARTVSTTANTVIGPQHPVYDYRLSGKGDLVLTRLNAPSALIETPADFERLLLVDQARAEVLVELGSKASRRVAVPAGRYVLHGWRGGQMLRAEVAVRPGDARLVSLADFSPAPAMVGFRKGDAEGAVFDQPHDPRGLSLLLGIGAQGPAAASLDFLPAVRLRVSGAGRRGPTLALDVASGRGQGFRENRLELLVGFEQRWRPGSWRFTAGTEAGAGWTGQAIDGQGTLGSGVFTAALLGSAGLMLGPSWSMTLLVQAPASLVRREGKSALLWQPAFWLGPQLRF